MQERIFRETQKARNLSESNSALSDGDFLEYIQSKFTQYVVNYETGNYLMRLNSESCFDILISRYLFYFNSNCYLFCISTSHSNELVFFIKTPSPANLIESFQVELGKAFRTGGRNLSGWNTSPLNFIHPIISTSLKEDWA